MITSRNIRFFVSPHTWRMRQVTRKVVKAIMHRCDQVLSPAPHGYQTANAREKVLSQRAGRVNIVASWPDRLRTEPHRYDR